MKNDKSG